jgi:UDP-N-acetylglucosamine:LPS N-acetylglucosamine transferase
MVVAVDMGYGHLRAAWPLAEQLGISVSRADLAPYSGASERIAWRTIKRLYERLSRLSQNQVPGHPFLHLLDRLTAIDGSIMASDAHRPDRATRLLAGLIEMGFGRTLSRELDRTGASLLTTFYAPALAADWQSSSPVFSVVTDSDIHRVWAPANGNESGIHHLVPAPAAADRLLSYGVRRSRIACTGFPLPPSLTENAPNTLDQRLGRLDGKRAARPRVTLAIGGAGAQAGRARELLRELGSQLRAGEVRLALVAGLRHSLARRFRRWSEAELGSSCDAVEVVEAEDFRALYGRFNELLERTDVLWTKPSELSFYAALGLPMILDDPVGAHEHANARLLLDAGAALTRPRSSTVGPAIRSWLADGTLARCARCGFERLNRDGTESIIDYVFNNS